MLPILPILIGLGISSVAFIYFWNNIREFLNGTFRNFIQERFGVEWGKRIGTFLSWLDDKVVAARQSAKQFAVWFKSRIMIKTTYTKNNSNQAISKREIVAKLDNGKFIQRIEEQVISYDDLPNEIRREMIRQQTTEAQMNDKELIEKKIEKRAKEENFTELLTMNF
ncbi:MAG: hypothetical protein LBG58_03165 [Planctomycetaceae bacterium]|jgi:hypothetical protein|nr:hypothetical protein [Planctomycetaceae bacterium]